MPTQMLNHPELRFCKILKGTKKPFELDWTNKPYTYEQIQDYVKSEVNYGVLCGYGNLAVIDCDETLLQDHIERFLPETYKVKTGSGGTHNYYFIPGLKQKLILYTNDKHLGEVQSSGTQVVGPGSIHPNGNTYQEINQHSITTISVEQLLEVVKPFIKEIKQSLENANYEFKENSELDSLSVASIWGTSGLQFRNSEYYGPHPTHGSEGGMNFWINPTKNVWHCFRCNSGGGPLSAIAVKEGIINCSNAVPGYIRGDKAREVIKIAQERYGLKKQEAPKMEYDVNQVNYLDGEFFDCWSKVKGYTVNQIKKDEVLRFFAHNKNKVIGKPIQISETMQTIALVHKLKKKDKDGNENIIYKFIDDRFDARSDGQIEEVYALDFWLYRIVSGGKEFILFSKEQLGSEQYEFTGMSVKVSNLSEINKNLKFKSIATIFFVQKAECAVKVLNKDDLVRLCKSKGLTKESFKNFIFTHPKDNCIYDHTPDYNLLTIAQILSGEYEGYPLHRMVIGPVGTGKTTEMECIDSKYLEDVGIFEAGNSTIKGLIPSFKEKPANPGYLLKCNRIALADELMKMVQNMGSQSRYQELLNTYFGQLNMLLEHKERFIGSGNDNSFKAKATSKVLFMTNPIPGKDTIYSHIGLVDETTLSRMVIWVQDKEQQDKIDLKVRNKNNNTYRKKYTSSKMDYIYADVLLYSDYLSIVDSCSSFLINFDENLVRSAFNSSLAIAKDPMKRVWKARGLHHSILILDGIVKYRCLFQDYDSTFEVKQGDYENLERLLIHMVTTWDTNLSGKPEDWRLGFK